jgi:hypothetical protein
MTLWTPKFRPGFNKLDTSLRNEGGFNDGNFVRVHYGMMQTLGGWVLSIPARFDGKARASHAWRTAEGKRAFAFGTSEKLYCVLGGALRDITPDLHNTVVNDAFTTVDGSPIVTVHLPFHGLVVGNEVTFANHQSTVGGLTIEGTFTVEEVLTVGKFTIDVGSNASSDVTTPAGGHVDFVVPLPEGLESNPLSGYGTGTYGSGPYGASLEAYSELRDWTMDNWGEYLLANPSGYGLFEFQPETQYRDLAYNGDFDGNADGWGLGTGWAYDTDKVTKTAGTGSNLSQDVDGVLEGGRYYVVTFDVTQTAGTLKFKVNAGLTPSLIDLGAASAPITKSGSYSRIFLCPADPQDVVWEADSTFAGSVTNITYKLVDRAYRIPTAPPRIDSMFVDPRGLVVALGTTQIDGTYSATCVRCSDLGNNRSWVPDSASLASEYTLRGGGGRLMGGIATRQQNLVWGDEGVFSAQWKGAFGDAYNINLLGTGCGLVSRHAMAEQNGFVFWMANTRQFFIFRGLGATSLGIPEIIPCPVREDVFDNLLETQSLKCHAGINSAFSEAWFFYPDARDGDECSRVAVVSWTEGGQDSAAPWVQHRMARTTWEGNGTLINPLGLTPDGLIMEHEVGYTANGQPLGEWLETSDFDIQDGDNLLAILGLVPDFAGLTGNVRFTITTRNYPLGPEIVRGPYTSTPSQKRVNFRAMGRQARIKLEGTQADGFWRMGALRLDLQKTGARR